MLGAHAFDQRDSLTQNSHITLDDAVHVFGYRQFTLLAPRTILQIGVHRCRLLHAGIDGQALVCFVVFGMFHSYLALILMVTFGWVGSLVISNRRR